MARAVRQKREASQLQARKTIISTYRMLIFRMCINA